MDEFHASLMAELASGHVALPVAIEMTLVAPRYEHLADHALNIARRAIYLERFQTRGRAGHRGSTTTAAASMIFQRGLSVRS
jgi:phosphate uptake regulator